MTPDQRPGGTHATPPGSPAVFIGGPRDGGVMQMPDDRDIWVIPEPLDRRDLWAGGLDYSPPRTGQYRAELVLGYPSRDDAGRLRLTWRGWS